MAKETCARCGREITQMGNLGYIHSETMAFMLNIKHPATPNLADAFNWDLEQEEKKRANRSR